MLDAYEGWYDDLKLARLLDAREEDAREEAWYDAHPPNMECGECGTEWWSPVRPATCIDPPEVVRPDCPECG